MEKIPVPVVESAAQKRILKLTLLNARRSATAGLMLLVLPFLFVFANIFKYELGIELGAITTFVEWVGSHDQTPVLNWIVRFLLLGGPAIAILVNLMAITHIYHNREQKELVVTLKIRWVNLSILIVCFAVLAIFALYLLAENIG